MSYSRLLEDGTAAYPASAAAEGERAAFLKKVYLLLFAGIGTFALSAALPVWGFMNNHPLLSSIFKMSVSVNPLIMMLLLFGVSFAVHSVSMVRGLNMVAYFAFAAFFGVITSGLIAFALKSGGFPVIMNATALTIMAFGGLTAYVLITGKDFSFMGGFLTVGLFLVIGVVVLMLVGEQFFGFSAAPFQTAISGVTVLLFSLYVLYDTSNILHKYSTDMVVPAAVALLVDFVILFRNILVLLMDRR